MIGQITNKDAKICRKRLLQMHYESGVGHIGGNLSVIDSLLVLVKEFMSEGNEIILSKGHSVGALYISLWHAGLLTDEDLRTFHGEDTLLPGHPPVYGNKFISFGTGSLGHGLSLAAGTALAFKLKYSNEREELPKSFCVTSDGEWQEGSTWEALIFAHHHNLKNLVVFIDHNNLQGFGSTNDIASMSPLWKHLKEFNIDIIIIDGHDIHQIREAASMKTERPLFVFMTTVKGKGVSFMENKMEWHYLALNKDSYALALKELQK